MIIALALSENHNNSQIDQHFGRCDWYCIYNSENKEKKFIANPNRDNDEGAGCNSAEMLLEYNINVAVAGRFGNKVTVFFRQHNVQMVIAKEDQTIEYIINRIKK